MLNKIKNLNFFIILILIVSIGIILFRPINYYLYNFNNKCAVIEDICITMSSDWFKDYYADIVDSILDSENTALVFSHFEGLTVTHQLQFVYLENNLIVKNNIAIYAENVLHHKLGKIFVLRSDFFSTRLHKVRFYVPDYNLLIVADSLKMLDEIVSITRHKRVH